FPGCEIDGPGESSRIRVGFCRRSEGCAMTASILEQLGGHGASAVLGLVFGSVIAWLLGRWKRRQERRSILLGDARDTVVIQYHLLDQGNGPVSDGTGGTTVPAV